MKQALRSSGANVTDKHIEDVCMSAMFLLEAAKKCDAVFGVRPTSKTHTSRDSKSDVEKMTSVLLEKEISKEKSGRTTTPFTDPTEKGMTTLTKGDWLQKQLSAKCDDNLPDNLQDEQSSGDLDIEYELSDIL